ncbi:PDR/VanB family oxidoreductase [Actinomycetospora sp. TBRC 11914]|uniref:PDR/VanB family oxidoreductase n=1 Tax=Actinomycetospora sp. TBRC 11914 TaxID=2729387 RepID=UPI00145C4A22|nr:PDR/VanB family oxidoreductase [Actinomycetospora sp. TBRC 11914]NMO89351.1 oxidoreductase [Actinomycetospora sp. TBRC 11914]
MLELRVADVATPCAGVRSVTLVGDGPLPSYPPGAHVGLEWAPGRLNPYSLTPTPSPRGPTPRDLPPGLDPEEYHLSIALRPDGEGGSRRVHALAPGDRVRATPPRSSFPPVGTAAHHVLVAGGIGVTPVLAHAAWHAFWGNSFEVLLVQRPGVTPHAADLRALAGDRLARATDRTAVPALLDEALRGAPWNSHVYTCGPPGLIAAVAATARRAHWVADRVHAEPFVHAPATGTPFTAVLRRSGREVAVGAGESLLDALDRAGVAAPRLCRQGVCGECVTEVAAGRVEHRDTVLGDDERDGHMALCVSRAAVGETVELQL